MALLPGTRLGSYEVTAQIGAGGMGEVYRATDSHLKRSVAIKVLPASVAGDADRLARFQREAEVLAALNHPNIAAIYGLEKTPDFTALVMELVEGEDLSAQIARGPMPLTDALPIAKQIAEALEAAHEQGIIHRDLKPANIKVRADGTVKVLDFGLAKAIDPVGAASGEAMNSPTMTARATQMGMIIGTAAYMSPEQAKGKAVDKRADIWAFGVVVYEMLTGQRAFKGDDVSDTLASVLKDTPEFAALPQGTPRAILELLKRCLDRDVKTRLRDIGEARVLLQNPQDWGVPPSVTASEVSHRAQRWWMAAALVFVGLTVLFAVREFRARAPEPALVARFTISPPGEDTATRLGVSPDGRKLAFIAGPERQVWIRALDSLSAQPLAGTARTTAFTWSPDGRFIAFASGGKMMRIDVSGGAPQTICTGNGRPSWSRDGILLFSGGAGQIYRVPAFGGTPAEVVIRSGQPGNARTHPYFLPDGRHFLYLEYNRLRREDSALFLASLDSGESQVILKTDSTVQYAAGPNGKGHLLYVRDSTLLAHVFDSSTLRLTGDPVPVAEGVEANVLGGGAAVDPDFSVSASGRVLAYSAARMKGSELAWYDRGGRMLGTVGPRLSFANVSLSADGRYAAIDPGDSLALNNSDLRDVWLLDTTRGTLSRLTSEKARNWFPIISPDGTRVAFTSDRTRAPQLYIKPVSGAGQEEQLLSSAPARDFGGGWSADGKTLAFYREEKDTSWDLWAVVVDPETKGAPRKPFPLLRTRASEMQPRISPDGKWIAYSSNETGRNEVYVQPFSPVQTGTGKLQMSLQGGADPQWRRDGKELFYLSLDRKMMAAAPQVTGGNLDASLPKALFEAPVAGVSSFANYAVHPDGRFLMRKPVEDRRVLPVTVVINWLNAVGRPEAQ